MFGASLLQAPGVTRGKDPIACSHLPSINTQSLPLDPCTLRSVWRIANYLKKLQDSPYGIETSGDDCFAWKQ